MADNEDNNGVEKLRIEWEFFKLHAIQRLTFFRYYIALIIASFIAYFYIYDHLRYCSGTIFLNICLILAGLGISCISYLFSCIDKRNVELLINSKNALYKFDYLSKNNPGMATTHGKLFRITYFMTIFIGILLSIVGGYKFGLDYYCSPTSICSSNNSAVKPSTIPAPQVIDKKPNNGTISHKNYPTATAKPPK